jgi:tetratricopeptide (TPR) repeat protein
LEKKLNTYIDELAPWEKRKEYYRDIQLGKNVKIQKGEITSQALKMITSQIASTNTIIASQNIIVDTISDILRDTERIGDGIFGMRAAFEWGISDVVWQIEMNSARMKEFLKPLYAVADKKTKQLREEVEGDYVQGHTDHALENFLILSKENEYDFSVHMSIGIIYLFHKIDKEKALNYFNKTATYAQKQSTYYTSYALLYKALIKRDYGLIEEAERLTKKAIKTLSNFSEAMYQNALYNALLNKPDKAIPLLRQAIDNDVVYCLKINNEPEFDGIRSEITKLLEEVRDERNEKIKNRQRHFEEKIFLLDNTIDYIMEIGHDVSEGCHTWPLKEKNTEITGIIANNSILDTRIAGLVLSQSNKRLQHIEARIKDKCLEIKEELKDEIQKIESKLSAAKKRKNLLYFIIYLFAGQMVAIPIGLSTETISGMGIAEAVLLALCAYWNIILPHIQLGKDYGLLRDKEYKLDHIKKRIEAIDFHIIADFNLQLPSQLNNINK